MKDFVHARIPDGESYVDLYNRVIPCFSRIKGLYQTSAIITHGGVMRSILAHISRTSLADSFGAFGIRYGCVIRIRVAGLLLDHEILSNPPSEPEMHRPKQS
jgi:alpha-ribazole phosphatase